MKITLYGASSDNIDAEYKEKVYELCKVLAKNGHSLIYGGGAFGLMGAAARGFYDGGGEITGIVPEFMLRDKHIYENCTRIIYTRTMAERKDIMEKEADAFLAVPGGIGTFDELFEILTLKMLKIQNKPVILYNVKRFWDPMLSALSDYSEKGFIRKETANGIKIAYTPEDVLYDIK